MAENVQSRPEIRVLHLISSSNFFGAERVVVELSKFAANCAGDTVILGVFIQQLEIIERFEEAMGGYDTTVVPFDGGKSFSWSEVRSLIRLIKKHRITIIHSHGYKSDIYAFVVRKLLKSEVQLIATNHNWIGISKKERLYQFIDSRVLRTFNSIVAVSELIGNQMVSSGISNQLISIIDNGIDWEDMSFLTDKKNARRSLQLRENEYVIGCVARLTQEKAHCDLLQAFSELLARDKNMKLVLIGDGPERESLEDQCDQLQINEQVIFAGNRKDARSLYAAFDSFALVSINEGLPMALLEAMASSLPVIVSRVGAIPNVINHNRNGIIVAPSDPKAIMAALLKCKSDPQFAQQIGQQAHETIVENYSSRKMAQNYESIYRECLR